MPAIEVFLFLLSSTRRMKREIDFCCVDGLIATPLMGNNAIVIGGEKADCKQGEGWGRGGWLYSRVQ